MSILQSPVCTMEACSKHQASRLFHIHDARSRSVDARFLIVRTFPLPLPSPSQAGFCLQGSCKAEVSLVLPAPSSSSLCTVDIWCTQEKVQPAPHQGLTKLKIKKKFVYLHTHLQREKSPSANGSFNLVVSSISRDLRREKEHLAALPCKINL